MASEKKRNLNLFSVVEKTKTNGGPMLNPYTNKPYSAKYFEILEIRQMLPMWQQKIEFLDVLAKNQTIIMVGGTGSGKSTQIPRFVVEAGYASNGKQVVCTQSSCVAAMSVCQRVADEMDVIIGDAVGYSTQYKNCSGPKTTLKYLTHGMLLGEAMMDPLLKLYRVIILDKAHERTLATDVLFGVLKVVLKKQLDLKLVIMVASWEVEKFQVYFNGALLMIVPGRLHPVEVVYSNVEHERDYLMAALQKVLYIHTFEPPSDILIFLAKQGEIEVTCEIISRWFQSQGNQVGPIRMVLLYFALPLAMQQRVLEATPPLAREGGPPG